MTPDDQTMKISNQLGSLVLQGMEEVMGRSGVNAVLNFAGMPHLMAYLTPRAAEQPLAFTDLSGLQGSLEKLYGPRSGAGLALRTGRAMFTDMLRQYGGELGLAELDFRLRPTHAKIRAGLEQLAGYFSRNSSASISVQEDERRYTWNIKDCPLCYERAQGGFACPMLVGMLQEFLYWSSGGKYFEVGEAGCADRDSLGCAIWIDKQTYD